MLRVIVVEELTRARVAAAAWPLNVGRTRQSSKDNRQLRDRHMVGSLFDCVDFDGRVCVLCLKCGTCCFCSSSSIMPMTICGNVYICLYVWYVCICLAVFVAYFLGSTAFYTRTTHQAFVVAVVNVAYLCIY